MVSAYVLIKTVPGREREVFEFVDSKLKPQLRDIVFGPFDIVVKLNAKDNATLIATVNKEIRTSPDVATVITLPVYSMPKTTATKQPAQ